MLKKNFDLAISGVRFPPEEKKLKFAPYHAVSGVTEDSIAKLYQLEGYKQKWSK